MAKRTRKKTGTQPMGEKRPPIEPPEDSPDAAAAAGKPPNSAASDTAAQQTSSLSGKPTNGHSSISSCLVEIPLSDVPQARFGIHIDTRLPHALSTTLRRVATALDRQQARLKNGERVTKSTQAMRWILEQIET